jgi:arylsulfatase A-like enzyme
MRMRRIVFSILTTLLLALPVALPAAEAPQPTAKPNIVLIMADDQGWGDTSYNGHPELKTPNLDALAASGLRLNRFYAAHCNCSPTRGSVMTGRHPVRYGTFSPGAPIRAQELTVAKVLQSAGYATGHFGKWHLNGKNGDKNTTEIPGRAILAADPLSPGKMGFDEWVSADNFFDLDPVLGRNGVPEKFHGDSSDVTTDEALKFIRKQAAALLGSRHRPRGLARLAAQAAHEPGDDSLHQEQAGSRFARDAALRRLQRSEGNHRPRRAGARARGADALRSRSLESFRRKESRGRGLRRTARGHRAGKEEKESLAKQVGP